MDNKWSGMVGSGRTLCRWGNGTHFKRDENANLFTQQDSSRKKREKTHKSQHLNCETGTTRHETHQTIPCAPDPIGFRF